MTKEPGFSEGTTKILRELKQIHMYKEASVVDPAWLVQFSVNFDPPISHAHNGFTSPWIKTIYEVANYLAYKIAKAHLRKTFRPWFRKTTEWNV